MCKFEVHMLNTSPSVGPSRLPAYKPSTFFGSSLRVIIPILPLPHPLLFKTSVKCTATDKRISVRVYKKVGTCPTKRKLLAVHFTKSHTIATKRQAAYWTIISASVAETFVKLMTRTTGR